MMSTSATIEDLWKTILPLSELPKTRKLDILGASVQQIGSLSSAEGAKSTRRVQQELALQATEKLTERVESLMDSVKESNNIQRQKAAKIDELIEKAVEQATVVVNRVQERLIEATGQPAQASVLQEVLACQLSMLRTVEQMQMHMMSIPLEQANLQASLVAVMAQMQQISLQVTVVRDEASTGWRECKNKLEELTKVRRNHNGEDDAPPLKRRKPTNDMEQPPISQIRQTLTPPDVAVTQEGSRVRRRSISNRNLLPHKGVSYRRLGAHPQATTSLRFRPSEKPLMPPDPRRTKAQRLATLLGDSEFNEEQGDLFSEFAVV